MKELKFTIYNVKQTVKLFNKVISNQRTMPVLNNVRVVGENGKLSIIGTDLKNTIFYNQIIEENRNFSFLINFKVFKTFGDICEIIISGDSLFITYTNKQVDVSLKLDKKDDGNFPITTYQIDNQKSVMLDDKLKNYIYNASCVVSSHYNNFSDVLIGKRIIGSDARRIYHVNSGLDFQNDYRVNFKMAKLVLFFNKFNYGTNDIISFSSENYTLVGFTNKALFPNIDKVMKNKNGNFINIESKFINSLSAYVKHYELLGDHYKCLIMKIDDNISLIGRDSHYMEELRLSMKVKNSKKTFIALLNSKNLLFDIKLIKADKIHETYDKAVVIESKDGQKIYSMCLRES